MDEQKNLNPDPVSQPASEAILSSSTTETTNLQAEIPQTTLPETTEMTIIEANQAEPITAPETAQNITPEPIPEILPETPTAQMAGNEPLPESIPEPTQPSTEATVEAPQQETPTALAIPTPEERPSEETPPKAEESPRTSSSTQQGTSQPEPTPTPASSPESMPAQAQVTVTPPRNIARLLLEKAKLTIQLRKQKKLLKIMNLFEKKKHITNDDVEKLA